MANSAKSYFSQLTLPKRINPMIRFGPRRRLVFGAPLGSHLLGKVIQCNNLAPFDTSNDNDAAVASTNNQDDWSKAQQEVRN